MCLSMLSTRPINERSNFSHLSEEQGAFVYFSQTWVLYLSWDEDLPYKVSVARPAAVTHHGHITSIQTKQVSKALMR